jgi:hypothetical protein
MFIYLQIFFKLLMFTTHNDSYFYKFNEIELRLFGINVIIIGLNIFSKYLFHFFSTITFISILLLYFIFIKYILY